jgi:hypothetical protein
MAVFSVIFAAMFVTAFAYLVWLLVADWRDLQGRGEVADVPEEPTPKSPDEFPAKRTCRFNATPHWCADTSSDDAAIAELERQFPKTQPRRIR